ncbi:hypothetical protein E3O42_02450 [Cryobacterium adonitolivorans]|uniref:Large extracellular alpha-helical protein n=1 Tax=Cryobacterium adonitolivorans TaxID=1259189 RepID=A0A4R8WAY0_9MICO|nr:DUF5719 family protein [Cryobacterium adonitolivorans]TFC05451.1 hypothetical protein E3O42_02450 [Cryobacterium adonitolivorans]
MATKRRVAVLGARYAAGLIGIAVVVVAVGGAAIVPWPTVVSDPPSTLVTPVASDQLRVCPGPLLTLAEDSTQADAATSIGSSTAVYAARGTGPGAEEVPVERTDLTATDNSQAQRDGAPSVLSVPVEDGATEAPLVAGSQSQTASSETIGGLAAAACTEASSDSWLVSGSTDVGRTSLVLLSNPTTVVASVDLAVYGEAGLVDAPGSTGILVQPGSQRIVSLAGLAPNLRSPAVHVTATGGQVAATLQQSLVRGIQPGGVELSGPTTTPATTQTIPGVVVSDLDAEASADVGAVAEDTPSVRVLVPGETDATVSVGVQSEDGASTGTSLEVEIQAGIATEIPLSGVVAGNYTVKLNADQPLVAAAVTTTAGGSAADFAWSSAAAPQDGDFLVSVAAGPSPALHLANTSDSDAELTITPEARPGIELSVAAGQTVVVGLAGSESYLVTGGSGIAASVGYTGDGQSASFTLSPIGPLAAAIPVYSH